MASRYSKAELQELNDLDYKQVYPEKFESYRKNFLLKRETLKLNYPSFDDVLGFDYEIHVWGMGDRYYKLADRYYGDPTYWWIIAWFNKKPTESHINVGDFIRVPLPLGEVLATLGY